MSRTEKKSFFDLYAEQKKKLTQSIIARRYNLNINGLFPKSEVQSNEI